MVHEAKGRITMKITEKNYIQQLQLHNEEALIYVIDMYGGLLKAVIRKHLFTMPQKQEECMNDVLLSIWEHAASFDDKKNSFKNWAAAIARYEAIDYLRKYKRDLEQLCMDDVTAAENDRMLEQLIEGELSHEVEQLLLCLKPLDRKIFMKLFVEEESVEQISEDTGLPRDVIYNRVSRGKRKMRTMYLKQKEA